MTGSGRHVFSKWLGQAYLTFKVTGSGRPVFSKLLGQADLTFQCDCKILLIVLSSKVSWSFWSFWHLASGWSTRMMNLAAELSWASENLPLGPHPSGCALRPWALVRFLLPHLKVTGSGRPAFQSDWVRQNCLFKVTGSGRNYFQSDWVCKILLIVLSITVSWIF